MIFPSTATILVASLAILSTTTTPSSFTVVDAHSWMDCVNWQPSSSKNSNNNWIQGRCLGYARRFPLKGAFGSLDSADPSRHYQQAGNPNTALPCSDHKHGKDVGSDETKANPVSGAYGGSKWGQMTVTQVGNTLCVRWPAKNHAEKNEDNTKVQINFSKVKDGKDPSQQDLLKNTIALLPYKNCNPGKNPDRRACGGCFKVPVRASGTYLMQWRWMLNPGEWYTSCADIQIGGGIGGAVQKLVGNIAGAASGGNGGKQSGKGKDKPVCHKVYKKGKLVGRKCRSAKN